MFTTLLAMAVEPAFAYILIPALILSAWSKIRLKLAYRKYDKKITSTGMSGAEIARKILDENNLYYVRIGVVKGEMTDYYDPLNMMLCLSEATYYTCSVAAAGIAAHEAGHAIQHVRKYFPMVLRKAAVPITNLGTRLAVPAVVTGHALGMEQLVLAGTVLFGLWAFFQLTTLPVELDASRRAIGALESSGCIANEKERKGIKRVLAAAAMTYFASLATSIVHMCRFRFLTK